MPVKILVVDDEADVELLIRSKFRSQKDQFTFEFATNGRKALDLLEKEPDIEIVLVDLNMPEMDGLTLLSHLREKPRLLKAIVVSAYGDTRNIRKAMNRGAFDFVTKPIDFEDIETTIRKSLSELERLKEANRTQKALAAVQCELNLAARIQHALLPKIEESRWNNSPIELYAQMVSARVVGGDFYDVFEAGPDRIGFLIGDVAGKGIPASLLMATTRTIMRAIATEGLSPGDCLSRANEFLCRENIPGMFVTMIYGVLNEASGILKFSVAGHNMPYLFSEQGAHLVTAEGGLVLGVLDSANYPTASIQLRPGEGLLLYTDGVTEALNVHDEEFSSERVHDVLNDLKLLPVNELVPELFAIIQGHSKGVPQSDDITLLAIRYLGRSCMESRLTTETLKKAG